MPFGERQICESMPAPSNIVAITVALLGEEHALGAELEQLVAETVQNPVACATSYINRATMERC